MLSFHFQLHSHLQKINAEANVSLDALYTSYSRRNSKKCPHMFKKNPEKSFTKTPLQACQTHRPSTALHWAPSHLISALYAHKSAYTKQQCCTHDTVSTSTTIQGREARHKPSPSHHWGKGARASIDQTEADDSVGLYIEKRWNRWSSLPTYASEKIRGWLVVSSLSSPMLRVNPRHPRMQH